MKLTVVESRRGAKHKHPTTLCRCACGRERVVRTDRLRRGVVTACATCARKDAAQRGAAARRLPSDIALTLNVRGVYMGNARKKQLAFDLDEQEVGRLIRADCHYCGAAALPTNGIDRLDSSAGYVAANVVTACSTCNYAKRDMALSEFLAWVERIHGHQRRLLQRDRQVLLRLAEQPDGCVADHAGGDR